MNRLDHDARAQILHLLCEGQSIRAVTRVTGASKNTVTKLLIAVGRACMAYHDENVRNVEGKRVQVDEIWSFTYAKARNVSTAKAAPEGAGDTWTWFVLPVRQNERSPGQPDQSRPQTLAELLEEQLLRRRLAPNLMSPRFKTSQTKKPGR